MTPLGRPSNPPTPAVMKSSDAIRPSSRRGASGAWNRLKPVREDILESYGLPSKGETRLNDFKTQEVYFNRIIERYMKLCALNREELDRLFASTSSAKHANANATSTSNLTSSFSALALSKHAPPPHASTTTTPSTSSSDAIPPNAFTPSQRELSTVLSSLRKLREALTATSRTDAFALRAYTFCIHVSILCLDWSSYLPSLHTLLQKIHPLTPLSPPDLKEYVGLLILDQACRQSDLALARETKVRYGFRDWRVESVLQALVRDDYVGFWRARRGVDGYQRKVMGFKEGEVRVHALKCIGRAYLSADRGFVERCVERGWEELVEDGVGWELVGEERVVIRRAKGG